ncbi:MAG: NUDIX domain-containing protein [Chloroflexi bacterium]|nr:NUDIX domain-containing protein [Chloroflexota bacterium]
MTRQISHLLRAFPIIMRVAYRLFSRAQARYTLGVAAVILNDDGLVLLVEHAYHPRLPWGLPGGWLNGDEEPATAITRELQEELQLQARVIRVVYTSKTVPNHIDLAFHCEALSQVGDLSHELLAYRWFALDQLPDIKEFHRRSIEAVLGYMQGREEWDQV